MVFSTLVCFGKPAKVIRVIDGDTFVIETGERVRMLGINAPEMKTPEGEPAKEHLLAMIDGKVVDLEPDHISANKDVYGRLLRYVILDGVDIDKKMVTDGYAIAFLKYSFDKEAEYKVEEDKAKAASLGIWKEDSGGGPAVANNQSPIYGNRLLKGIIAVVVIVGGVIVIRRRRK